MTVRHFKYSLPIVLTISFSVNAALAPESFGVLPGIYDASISPDASQVAVLLNIDGQYGVRIVTLDKKDQKLRVAMLGKGVKPDWIRWANNDRVLLGIWRSETIYNVPTTSQYIFSVDALTMDGKILIKPRNFLRQNNADVIDYLREDADHILMAFSNESQQIRDIQLVNVKTGRYTRIKRGRTGIQKWYTDGRGEPRIGQGRSTRPTKEEVWNLIIRDADDDKWRRSHEFPGLNPDVPVFGFTADPNELLIGDLADKDTLGLYVYDLVAKKITREVFHNENYDVGGLVTDSEGVVIGARFSADAPETELFDEHDTFLNRVRKRFQNYTVDYVDQSHDGGRIIFKLSNGKDPGALMLGNATTNSVERLAFYQIDLPANELGTVVSLKYRARDGFEIPAYVTLPPSVTELNQIMNAPAVILPHGGPYARTSKRFDYFAQFFATRGFTVLQMNFRGSAGYGETFKEAGRENWVLMQEDVEDGTRWLIDEGYADPERTCIAGWSYGGYAALIGAIKNPELYACAISMAGVTDLQDMMFDIRRYQFGHFTARHFLLRGFEDRRAIRENSPVKRADELMVPLFLAHGEDDDRVHFDQFKRMRSALRKNPVEVTYMQFEDEDHFLSNQGNRQTFFKGLDEFLRSTVGESEHAF